ncbi:MAG TPA: ABC transporter permease [Thermoanaerobaculia bacterium]|nr:ABC transporter permease [Thermoanaerobaculia bacterium]
MMDEIRQSARGLLKSPGFTLVSVGTLALGIASATALFSIVSSIILNPLPYSDPNQLVKVWEVKRNEPVETARRPASFPNFSDWRQRSRSFEHLAAVQEDVNYQLTGGDEPYRVEAARVSAEIFPLLGRGPVVGRAFSAAEDRPDAEPVVLLAHGLWQRRFGSDPQLVGRTLTLNGRQVTVVGIMPRDFHFPNRKVEMWTPLAMDPVSSSRWARFLNVYGRLRPGVLPEKAQQELVGLAAQLEQENQGPNTDMTAELVPLKEEIVGNTERPLWLLLGAVAFVLLIALVNVINLFLLRILGRERDIAVCTVLGVSQKRIIRQFLTESLLLALLGGAGGLLLALWGVRLFVAISPETIPRLEEVTVNPPALLLTLLVSLAAALILGLSPGLSLQNQELGEVLRVGSRGTEGVARRRLRGLLVVTEIALSVVLLVGAGLMMASFVRLFQVRTGLQPDRVLTLQFTLPGSTYPEGAQKATFYTRVLDRVSQAPGLESVGLVNHLPLSGSNTHWSFHVEGQPAPAPGQEPQAGYRVTDSGYFRTLGIPLAAGRLFTASDHLSGSSTVLVNETLAQRFWPRGDVLGKRLKLGEASATDQPWLTVVGIVSDVRHNGLAAPVEPELFLPYSPDWYDPMTLVVRTSGPPLGSVNTIRSAVWELDKNLPLYNVKTMEQVLMESLAKERFNMALMGTFAAVALFLSLVGIYGIMAQSVAQQTQSIAVQIALGATRRDVLWRVLQQGMRLVAAGIVFGVLVALGVSHLLSSLLFGITATDPMTFGAVVLLFFVVALAAVYLPALRATRVDPMMCLKA